MEEYQTIKWLNPLEYKTREEFYYEYEQKRGKAEMAKIIIQAIEQAGEREKAIRDQLEQKERVYGI